MGAAGVEELRVGTSVRPVVTLLGALRKELARLDPGQLPARDALELVTVLDRVGRVADAGKMTAALRVGESSLWKRTGARSAADWLAKVTGVGVGDAVRLLKTAEAVGSAAQTSNALHEGTVSPRQAAAIAKVERVSKAKGTDLLGRADTMAVTELESEANRIVASESPETDAEVAERHRKARRLRSGVAEDGMGWGSWRLPPAAHARLMARLGAEQDGVFRAARRSRDHEPSEAYAADALMRLVDRSERTCGDGSATSANGSSPSGAVESHHGARSTGGEPAEDWSFAKVIVRVDLHALDRGQVGAGEVCEIAGKGPIPVADAWKVIDGDAFVAAITTRGTEIDKVIHLGRKPTVLQRTALEWATAGTCVIRGCDSTARLEIDHVADWATTHITQLGDLAGPCGHHHDLKTHHGYRYGPVGPDGKRDLVPPDGAGSDQPAIGPAPPPPTDLAPRSISDTPSARTRTRPDPADGPEYGPGQGDLFDTG